MTKEEALRRAADAVAPHTRLEDDLIKSLKKDADMEKVQTLHATPEISRLDFFTAHALTGMLMGNWQAYNDDQMAEAAIKIAEETIEQLDKIEDK